MKAKLIGGKGKTEQPDHFSFLTIGHIPLKERLLRNALDDDRSTYKVSRSAVNAPLIVDRPVFIQDDISNFPT